MCCTCDYIIRNRLTPKQIASILFKYYSSDSDCVELDELLDKIYNDRFMEKVDKEFIKLCDSECPSLIEFSPEDIQDLIDIRRDK